MKYVSSFLLLMVVLLVLPIDAVDFSGKWEIVQAKESRAKLIKTGSIITLSGDVIIRHDADEYRADTVIIYEKEEIVVLHGSVKVLRRDASVTADNCEYRSAQDAAIFTGNVIITQKNATITGTRALIRTETADIEVTGDVYFSQENYSGIADYFYYNDTLQTIFLDGIPYIIFDDNYAGGDNMMIFLDNNGDIDRAEINLHADLFFRRENQDVQLYSEYMTIYFSNKNEPLYADLLRDVRVIMYEKEYIQTMNGHTMRADFEGKTVKTVFVKGNVSGSRKKREPSDEKNKPSKS